MTVGELIDTLKRHDPDMAVVVDGYEAGYDSLTADNITEVAIIADAAKAHRRHIVGDHQRPEKLPEAGGGTGWGGEQAHPYTATQGTPGWGAGAVLTRQQPPPLSRPAHR